MIDSDMNPSYVIHMHDLLVYRTQMGATDSKCLMERITMSNYFDSSNGS